MFRVLDLSREPSGGFAAMLLAQVGADVLRVDDAGRAKGHESDVDLRLYLDGGKRVLPADLSAASGRRFVLDEAAHHDVILLDGPPAAPPDAWLTIEALRASNQHAVVTSISPFGLSGPRAHWKSSELIHQAMGGVIAASGHSDGPPTRLAGWQAGFAAGLHAAIVTLSAVYSQGRGEHAEHAGVNIDVSIQEVWATHWAREVGRYAYTGEGTGRSTQSLGLQGFPHTVAAKDGFVFLLPLRAEWETFAAFLGLDDFLTHEWSDVHTRVQRWPEIAPSFHSAVASRGRYDWFAAAAEQGWTLAPVEDPRGLMTSPQLAAREHLKPAKMHDGSEYVAPGLPYTSTRKSD